MIIQGKEDNSYMGKMLANNPISGLLNLEIRITDNVYQYYYDITSKQSLVNFLEKKKLKKEQIRCILCGIMNAVNKTGEYLLQEDDFVLNPEYIFLQPSNLDVSVCYLIGYQTPVKTQMIDVIMYLMDKVDYGEEEAVTLIYKLYHISQEEDYTFEELWDGIYENEKNEAKKTLSIKEIQEKEIEIEDRLSYIDIKEEINEKTKEAENTAKYFTPKTYALIAIIVISSFGILYFMYRFNFFENYGKLDYIKAVSAAFVIGVLAFFIINYLCQSSYRRTKAEDKKSHEVSEKRHEVKVNNQKVDKQNISNDNTIRTERVTRELQKANAVKAVDLHVESDVCCELQLQEKTVLIDKKNEVKSYRLIPEDKSDPIISITEFPFIIGKLKQNKEGNIPHKEVSRIHGKIEREGNEIFITDLNSTNGTYINHVRLKKYQKSKLQLGDKITFANVQYYFDLT